MAPGCPSPRGGLSRAAASRAGGWLSDAPSALPTIFPPLFMLDVYGVELGVTKATSGGCF